MLPAERCDPCVVSRNWRASSLQFQPDGRVVPRRLNPNIKDGASFQHSLERPFVRLAVARLGNTESELSGYNEGIASLRAPDTISTASGVLSRYAERAFVSRIKSGPQVRFVRIPRG